MRRRISKPKRFRRNRVCRGEHLEQRRLLAANPLGVTPLDTGEFLLGKIAVTTVLFESDGTGDQETQDWTAEEIDTALARVTEGVNWWSDTLDDLNTVHSIEFVIDDTFAVDPVETDYEPIERPSNDFYLYVGDFVVAQGYGDSASIEEAVQRFNVDQRERLGTDWSFTIFVVDASEGDGLFAPGGSFGGAFAYAGGLFMVVPSSRPASTIAHEMGHIFWARDEYLSGGSWEDFRGYYNTQNLNAANNPTEGFEQQDSIMAGGEFLSRAYRDHVSPESTLAMVGWQDSDGDGVFDLADVPLELDALGYFDPISSSYLFSGSASAVPLVNQNSSGPQSDITLNRISSLQYSLDGGGWVSAADPDQQHADFDLSIAIEQPFDSIQWRVIDEATGITSAILDGSSVLPAVSNSSISGIAFLDTNANGLREQDERVLASTVMKLRNADGTPVFGGLVAAADYPEGALPSSLDGVSLSGDGIFAGPGMASFQESRAGGAKVFHSYDNQRGVWEESWSSKVAFHAEFDQVVGEVSMRAYGMGDGSYARLEAYDDNGELLTRSTTPLIAAGSDMEVRVSDPMGRIASIRAFGHAETSILLDRLEFGGRSTVVTDASGVWSLGNLPEGNYQVQLVPELLIHSFDQPSFNISVVAGGSGFVQAAAERVDSPRHNTNNAADVNQDGEVTAVDALRIINDMARFSPRILQPGELSGDKIDVNNDGKVSAIDALNVINRLAPSPTGGEGESVGSSFATGSSPAPGSAFAPALPFSSGSAANSFAVASDLVLATFTPIEGVMFNSAGRDTGDESIDRLATDNEKNPIMGDSPELKLRDFAIPDSVEPDEFDCSKDDDNNKNDDNHDVNEIQTLSKLKPSE